MTQALYNVPLQSAALAIKASSNADAKAGAFLYRVAADVKYTAATATIDLSASSGTLALADGKVACVAIDIDASGTVTQTVGTHVTSANINDAKQPRLAADKARVGYIYLKNATGSAFTIGTTALDTASMTVEYVNVFNPALGNFEA